LFLNKIKKQKTKRLKVASATKSKIKNKLKMDLESIFHLMKDSTVCFSDKKINIVFNDMCHTLHTKWNIEKPVLGKLMEDFGHIYMESCSECGTEFVWDEVCPECE